ncbi:MAG TPA: insulinase family protein [Haliscomenobacter sp.]|uniref:M16 family metallopeptidase n=1 Tax=Haliscomenobacter sp. TaxID=2717303 RepID=UPI002CB52BCE|nr:insulinase family protein [Haliscomenobacter sp.]HOY18946.1 insulinase family protein [Haliscomenobacter sp.]
MKRSIFLLALLLSSVLTQLWAKPPKFEWKQATANGYTYKYVANDPMQTRFYTLKNGLTVILSPNKKEPRIRTLIAVRAGSNTDPATNTGLAHYLEHLLFKGTDKIGSLDWAKEKPLLDQIDALYEKYNKTTDPDKRAEIYREIDKVSGEAAKFAIANEYDKTMKNMGGVGTNAHTSVEETVYEEDIPSNAIDRFLTLQAERFRKPIFRIFHTELEAVYEEKNRTLDEDPRKILYASLSGVFPTHNYGQQTTIGTIEHLKNPSLVEIRNYYNKYYVANNMAFIFAGDFNPDEVVKKIDQKFGFLTNKPVPEYKPLPEKPLLDETVKEVWGPSAESVRINFRMPGELDVKSSVLLTLCDEILSNAQAGLIDLNLNKAQKIQSGGSSNYRFKDYSVEFLFGTPKQGQSLEEVKNLLMAQLDKLKKGEFEEWLIKAIVANYKLNALRNLENNDDRAIRLSDIFIRNKGLLWADEVAKLDAMGLVSKQQVVDFAKKHFSAGYVVVYKRQGEDKSAQKVQKPTITPVAVNKDAQSPLFQEINQMPLTPIAPAWMDYQKDFQRDQIKGAELFYVQNKDDEQYRLSMRFEMGTWSNKLLPLAAQYLQLASTDKYTADQFSQELFKTATAYNFTPGQEFTTLTLSGLQEHLGAGLALVEELIRNCKADEQVWNNLKARLLKSRKDAKSNKNAIRAAVRSYAQYGAKNPFNHVLSDADLNALKAEDLVNLLKDLFNHKHQIIYYGPKTLAEIKPLLEKAHALPTSFKANPAKVNYAKITQDKPQVLFANYDMVQTEIDWIRNTEIYNPQLAPTLNVFNNYFGAGGFSCLVVQTLRESKALAYATQAYYAPPGKKDERYTMQAYIQTQADKFKEAVEGMNELLNELPESEVFLTSAKTSIKNGIETDRTKGDDIVFSYLAAQLRGVDHDDRKHTYEKASSIAYHDLKAFHAANISNKAYTLCVLGSDKRLKMEDLKAYGEVKSMSLEELFGY